MSPTKTTNLSMRINNSSTACDTEYEKSTQIVDAMYFNELSYFLPVGMRLFKNIPELHFVVPFWC